MATAVIDEILEKVETMTDEDRQELVKRIQEQEKKTKPNGKKGYVSPDTIWVKENRAKYAGLHIALKDGKLIATGKTIKEANEKAKAKGVENPRLAYMFPPDEIPFGGW
ncbi:MAG: DUF5678 domain-containing protein [Aridibacter sp.]